MKKFYCKISTSKSDIANFERQIFMINSNENVISNNSKLNELSKKVKAISTKGLTKKNSILIGAKYFSLGVFQNHLVFVPAKK